MTILAVWILGTLAAYRLWRLLALDDLPGIAEARGVAERRLPDRWADAIVCPWCLGFWCCLLVFVAADVAGVNVPAPILQVAAASTVVGLIGANLDG